MSDGKKLVGPVPESKLTQEARKLVSGGWGDNESNATRVIDPEWLIFFGKTRTGKSNQALSCVEYATQHAIDREQRIPQAYVIDTDMSGRRDLQNYPLLQGLGNVHHRYCQDVEDVLVATCALVGDETVKMPGLVKPGDWIIVDRATVVWEKMPNYWCLTRLKKTVDQLEYEYQMQAAEGKIKQGSALLEYYRGGINPLWFSWETAIRMSGAHCIFLCADQELQLESTKIRNKDSTEKITNFLSAGVVPRMQGDTWARWHTQILLERPYAKPQWFAKTVGDRGNREWLGIDRRREVKLEGPETLGSIYLGEIAGWNSL